jgi:hypothetical protein
MHPIVGASLHGSSFCALDIVQSKHTNRVPYLNTITPLLYCPRDIVGCSTSPCFQLVAAQPDRESERKQSVTYLALYHCRCVLFVLQPRFNDESQR